jgi:hypothetical protein
MTRLLISALSIVLMIGVASAGELAGFNPNHSSNPPERPEDLYQGDLIPEQGLGCSNGTGNSGGPNDVVVGVAAACTPPFSITSHYYDVYTQNGYVTALSFIALTGMAMPGTEIGRQAGLDPAVGAHTVAISPPIMIPDAMFFFGHNQPQSAAGMRWGLDTSSSAGTSYIRAPSCGATAYTLVDQLGYPGNWCFSVSTDASSPVEMQSWGSVKALFQ